MYGVKAAPVTRRIQRDAAAEEARDQARAAACCCSTRRRGSRSRASKLVRRGERARGRDPDLPHRAARARAAPAGAARADGAERRGCGSPGRSGPPSGRPTSPRTSCATSRSRTALVDNKVAAIDEIWSGLQLVIRVKGPTTLSLMPTCLKISASRTSRPKAYEHPADRAATAALQQIPMMDTVVRKLIEFGERSVVQQLLAGAVRLGEDQLPEVWASHRAALARLDIDYDARICTCGRCRSPTRWRSAPRSRSWCSTRARSSTDGRARAADRARARGGPHPLRPHALPDGAVHPAADRRRPADAAAVLRRPAAAGDPARAAGVVPRRRADAATARRRSSTAAR